MMHFHYFFSFRSVLFSVGLIFLLTTTSCKKNGDKSAKNMDSDPTTRLFRTVASDSSGLVFVNTLEETLESNYYQYMYTYIGGGVAVGDINNDGLVDLYLTSNSSEDKLYLNQGGLSFKDITSEAGMNINDGFNTGVTMVDINNDGLLDIYVSRGGWLDEDQKFANLLYINNGDLTFTEKAKELGLADENRTIQATFFDYDNDNDLDVYVSNTPDITSRTQVLDLDKIHKDPETLALKGSDRLYQNDGTGHFKDVSEQAGLVYDIGFGLNPQVGDLNNDGWLDVYVCNDFNYPDLAYINNGNGTFSESRNDLFKHMSFNSMGSDMADIDNDGLLDLMTLDMNPSDYVRSKTTMAMTPIDQFELMVDKGYHYQYMHNMLQVNNGNGTFSEISKMAGMADTDWSWAILSADFDLDGYNDIFVTNGVYRDVIDQDKNNEILQILREKGRKPTPEDFLNYARMLPQQKLHNYFFRNNGDSTFEDATSDWTDHPPTFSNGAVYADLDNDGDLDVVINNINAEATLLENTKMNTVQNDNYLKVSLKGPETNVNGVGATVKLHFDEDEVQIRQLVNTKGFLSSMSNTLHFGLGNNSKVKKLEVIWPDGKVQNLTDVSANERLSLDYQLAEGKNDSQKVKQNQIFERLSSDYRHKDPYFNDFDIQILLPHKLSHLGPAIAKTDLNKDGFEDVYLGGGHGQPGQLLFGNAEGSFISGSTAVFENDKDHEDVGATFFDADGDGDQDLYVVSGSYEFYGNPRLLVDRLYLNQGNNTFVKDTDALPQVGIAGSVVKAADYDKDGDIDLFVGGRLITGRYPHPASSALLINNNGTFTMGAPEFAPELEGFGMVTDAIWTDMNNDDKVDLVVTGEWMGIQIFLNEGNKLVKSQSHKSLADTVGWWNRLLIDDIDNDGDKDIVAGNLGVNYKFHASLEKPFEVYASDFDFSGSEDVILSKSYNGVKVPIRGKTCMTQQLPQLAQKIPTYKEFANKDIEGIIGDGISTALHYKATEFRSGIFVNNGSDGFSFEPFDNHAQKSPINSLIFHDFDGDGYKDLLMAGNNYQSEVETTRADAGIGSFLKGNGKGNFAHVSHLTSGFFADKDVRNMVVIEKAVNPMLLVVNNNDSHDLFAINN
ncbi:MAG: VCBS repeat-containing protein [Flavobacteriaceae bacterium]